MTPRKKPPLRAVEYAIRTYQEGIFYKEWVRGRARLLLAQEPDRLTVRKCAACKGTVQGRRQQNPRHLVLSCPYCGKWYYEGTDITIKKSETAKITATLGDTTA